MDNRCKLFVKLKYMDIWKLGWIKFMSKRNFNISLVKWCIYVICLVDMISFLNVIYKIVD